MEISKVTTETDILNTLKISNYQKITTGRVNQSFSGTVNDENIFIKINLKDPEILSSEERSLNYLNKLGLATPKIKHVGSNYLIFEYINTSKKNSELLNTQLEKLHSNKNQLFGFDHDTYVGTLKVPNKWCASWSDFFSNNRWKILFDDLLSHDIKFRETWILSMKIYDIIPKIFEGEKIFGMMGLS